MIKKLEVKNFKSIKDLKLDCKKVNIFVGKPNTGKSNILESLGVLSSSYGKLREFVRFESEYDLFYDHNTEEAVEITTDGIQCEIAYGQRVQGIPVDSPFRFYRFEVLQVFPEKEIGFLLPPAGENLLSVILTNKTVKKMVTAIFRDHELRVVLKPEERKMEVQKEAEDIIVSHPYSLVSDTLQRIVFYLVAIETNKDSVLIFEEPEAHAFPLYTKLLAERIALDKTNQYFVSTHDPFFLLSILEKAPRQDVGIFITYLKDYQTQVKEIPEKRFEEVLDLGANLFFNFDLFLGKE